MDPESPSNHFAKMQNVTPECSSRYLLSTDVEDSGYSSILSSGISTKTSPEISSSPIDVRKRLFDSTNTSWTPDISCKPRTSHRRSGRCIIPLNTLEEETEPPENRLNFDELCSPHNFSNKLKCFQRKIPTTPSPKKHHLYIKSDTVGKVCRSNTIFKHKTRTPPRKGKSSSPIKKYPSFSEPSIIRDPCRPRYGAQYVDFLWCLGKERMMAPALSLVLSHLSGEDLISCCIVSKTWQNIVLSSKNANSRRLAAIDKQKVKKENVLSASLRNRVNIQKDNRIVLGIIQQERLPPQEVNLATPPRKMSPKRFRFELYMKEGQRVDGNESQHLKPCPHCSFPSLVDTKLNLGVCSRQGCQYRFCTLCHCLEHVSPINEFSTSSSPPRYIKCPFAPQATTPPSPPQSTLLATRRRLDLVGSKRSRKNLRRL